MQRGALLFSPVRATKATTQPQGIIGTLTTKPPTVAPTAPKNQLLFAVFGFLSTPKQYK